MSAAVAATLPPDSLNILAGRAFRLTLLYLPLIPDNPLLPGLYPNPAILREVALPVLTHRVLRQQAVGPWLPAKLQTPDGDDGG
ncbi:MAG: hypothetical protein QOI49_1936 [Verrucomicrobiota bacterium]